MENKIHNTKKEAVTAIKQYANIMKKASEDTGANFIALSYDDSGMDYYVEALYRGRDKKIYSVKIHFQELNL